MKCDLIIISEFKEIDHNLQVFMKTSVLVLKADEGKITHNNDSMIITLYNAVLAEALTLLTTMIARPGIKAITIRKR